MSSSNKILISIWPWTGKFSHVLYVGKAVTFDSPWSRVGHALRPLFMLWLASSWGKFMQHLDTCLLIAEVDRVLCHLVIFLTVFLSWLHKLKYRCLQYSSMSALFIGFLVEKCAACQSHWKFDFVFTWLNVYEGWKAGLTWWFSGAAASRLVSLSNYFIWCLLLLLLLFCLLFLVSWSRA